MPEILEVRGEVYLPAAGFKKITDEQKAAGDQPFANPRNATAGSLKQLDPKIAARRPLEIVVYGLGEVSDDAEIPPTQAELLQWLKRFGLPIHSRSWLAHTVEEVMAAIDELDAIRHQFGFETDGAVIKLNDRCAARAGGLHLARAEVGEGLQVRAGAGADAAAGHHDPGRPHRRAHAGGGAGAGVSPREHDQPRDAAQ